MQPYRHILLTTDFSEHSDQTARRACHLAKIHGAELSILHVVEYLPIGDAAYGPIYPFDIDLTEQMLETARERMTAIATELQIAEPRRFVEVGSPKAEIIRMAETLGVDLIVMGTHGRHGIGVLLGSTAASVVHHAGCDVLVVRLQQA